MRRVHHPLAEEPAREPASAAAVGPAGETASHPAPPDGVQVVADPQRPVDLAFSVPAAARARAYELHAACGAALAGNRTLGGAVMYVSMGEHTLEQWADGDGLHGVVEFLVVCDAFTIR